MLKGYRTVIVNLLAAIVPVLQLSGADLGLTGHGLAIYMMVVNVANLALRAVTNTPVGTK